MPSIAAMLKQEITRLARREVKAQTKAIRKANAQYRRDVAHYSSLSKFGRAVVQGRVGT